MRKARFVLALLLATGGALISLAPASARPAASAWAHAALADDGAAGLTLADWQDQVWQAAAGGDQAAMIALLEHAPIDADPEAIAELRRAVDLFEANLAKREEQRAEKIATVNKELDELLAGERTDLTLSNALKLAVELHTVSTDKAAVLKDERVVRLVREAEAAARAAEERGDWLIANELYLRLHLLMESTGEFKDELEHGARRLAIIRTYAPERFWELRNERRVAEGEPPLKPYNPRGDDWRQKFKGIRSGLVVRGLARAAENHVAASGYADVLRGGLAGVRTLLTTKDLQTVPEFAGLKDEPARRRFLAFLDEQESRYPDAAEGRGSAGYGDLNWLVQKMLEANEASVDLPEVALLHEFANGAMASLDEFSGIIWPDEIRRFQRTTEAKFIGVGIQIQMDELMNIKVVTPLEGTPAQRAGIRAGDLIKKVDGEPTDGFTLDQAVDVITGPANTPVTLTVEREVSATETVELDFRMIRAEIPLYTVKGWRKNSPREDDWDWFIDPDNGIGYIRLTQFSEQTDQEFDRAVDQMKAAGLRGVILDLRFNPGGLLEQAVAITSRFVDPKYCRAFDAVVVRTEGPGGQGRLERLLRGCGSLHGLPVAVLINEGAASASEIVSGAVQDYAKAGDAHAVVIGQRSYGKGSVQNVWSLSNDSRGQPSSLLKLTTQRYLLPSGRLIHREPGAKSWGVDPDLEVEMLPDQIADAFKLRQDADVIRLDEEGHVITDAEPTPDPNALISEGKDLQLQAALVLLKSQTLQASTGQALLEPGAARRTEN